MQAEIVPKSKGAASGRYTSDNLILSAQTGKARGDPAGCGEKAAASCWRLRGHRFPQAGQGEASSRPFPHQPPPRTSGTTTATTAVFWLMRAGVLLALVSLVWLAAIVQQ